MKTGETMQKIILRQEEPLLFKVSFNFLKPINIVILGKKSFLRGLSISRFYYNAWSGLQNGFTKNESN